MNKDTVNGVSGVLKWFNALASTLSGGIPGIIAATAFIAILAAVGGWVYYKWRQQRIAAAERERKEQERKAREGAIDDSRKSEDQMKKDQDKLKQEETLALRESLDRVGLSDLVVMAGKKFGVDAATAAVGASTSPDEVRKEIYKLYGLH